MSTVAFLILIFSNWSLIIFPCHIRDDLKYSSLMSFHIKIQVVLFFLLRVFFFIILWRTLHTLVERLYCLHNMVVNFVGLRCRYHITWWLHISKEPCFASWINSCPGTFGGPINYKHCCWLCLLPEASKFLQFQQDISVDLPDCFLVTQFAFYLISILMLHDIFCLFWGARIMQVFCLYK